jgi:hypothetical protein
MPVSFLTQAERDRLQRFPHEVPEENLVRFFALSEEDQAEVRKQRRHHNRLAFALHICALRYLGFFPADLERAPRHVVEYVARQLDIDADLSQYGRWVRTAVVHKQRARDYLGFQRMTSAVQRRLTTWLLERALEHDTPMLLLELASDWLLRQRLLRPRITQLERLVAATRDRAEEELHRRLRPVLTTDVRKFLDGLLESASPGGITPLADLRRVATSNKAAEILRGIQKVAVLQEAGVADWDLSAINPNRLRVLAQIGRRTTNQAIRRRQDSGRYPILLAFLKQTLTDVTDEVLHMFESCLWERYSQARNAFKDHWQSMTTSTNEKLRWFLDIGSVVLDPSVTNPRVRTAIFRRISRDELAKAVEEAEEIVRPQDDGQFDYFARRYRTAPFRPALPGGLRP